MNKEAQEAFASLLKDCKTIEDVKELAKTLAEVCITSNFSIVLPNRTTVNAYD